MTLHETHKQLQSLGSAKVRAQNAKSGAGDNQFGVSLGDIRALAKKIRTNHELALSLWETGNVDAQFLATLLIQPRKLSAKEMNRMVRSSVSVLDCSHSKGRSGAENGRGRGYQKRTSLHFSVLEPCRTFYFKFEKGRPFVQSARRKCLFIYFYFMDREFGLICPGRGAGRGLADIGHQAYLYSHTA